MIKDKQIELVARDLCREYHRGFETMYMMVHAQTEVSEELIEKTVEEDWKSFKTKAKELIAKIDV